MYNMPREVLFLLNCRRLRVSVPKPRLRTPG